MRDLLKRLRPWKRSDIHWADGTVFMVRWTLLPNMDLHWKGKKISIKIHKFIKSDEEMHNHPWPFWSIILWRSYIEMVFSDEFSMQTRFVRRKWLSRVHHASSEYAHKVCVGEGNCWTLCITFEKDRLWGFFTPKGWVPFNDYDRMHNGRGRKVY